jgi:uncharacterized protein (TIGR02145 family)
MKKFTFSIAAMLCLASLFIVSCGKDDPDPIVNNPPAVGPNQFLDSRDNQVYNTVKLGNQTWMAENLNYNVSGSKCPANNPDSCAKYGKLYTYTQATSACPSGWHLPSDAEWKTLELHYGMSQTDVDYMSDGSPTPRGDKRDSLTKVSGFNGLYAGWFVGTTYVYNGQITAWWGQNTFLRQIENYDNKSIQRYDLSEDPTVPNISIRCIKD